MADKFQSAVDIGNTPPWCPPPWIALIIISLCTLVSNLPNEGPIQPSQGDKLEVRLAHSVVADGLIADTNRPPVLCQLQTGYFSSSIPLPDRIG